MEDKEKEVFFNEYCKTCKFYEVDESEDPCNECLGYPSNLNSHKPVMYKEGKKS